MSPGLPTFSLAKDVGSPLISRLLLLLLLATATPCSQYGRLSCLLLLLLLLPADASGPASAADVAAWAPLLLLLLLLLTALADCEVSTGATTRLTGRLNFRANS
jgi:hypothetical protein